MIKTWKAWGYARIDTGDPLLIQGKAYALGKSRKQVEDAAGGFANEYGPLAVTQYEIREVVPSPKSRPRGKAGK